MKRRTDDGFLPGILSKIQIVQSYEIYETGIYCTEKGCETIMEQTQKGNARVIATKEMIEEFKRKANRPNALNSDVEKLLNAYQGDVDSAANSIIQRDNERNHGGEQ